jgi:hypothetical protein
VRLGWRGSFVDNAEAGALPLLGDMSSKPDETELTGLDAERRIAEEEAARVLS